MLLRLFHCSFIWSPVTIRQHAQRSKSSKKKRICRIYTSVLWIKCLWFSLSCHPFKIELKFTLLVQSCHLRMKTWFDIFFYYFFSIYWDPGSRIYMLLHLMTLNGPCFSLKIQTTCYTTHGLLGILQSRWTWFLSLKLSLKPTETRVEPHAGSTLPLPLFISTVPARVLLPSRTSPSIRVARLSLYHPPHLPLPACVFWQNRTELPRDSGWHNIAPMASDGILQLLFISVFCCYSSCKKG